MSNGVVNFMSNHKTGSQAFFAILPPEEGTRVGLSLSYHIITKEHGEK
jgi:hypothetical protein